MSYADQLLDQALAALKQGDMDQASRRVREMVRIPANLGQTWTRGAMAAQAAGDFEVAREMGRRWYAPNPDDPMRALWYSDLTAKAGHVDEALSIARRILDARPDDPAPNYITALYLAQLGQFDEAEVLFRRARALKPDLPSWEQIAALKHFSLEDPDIAAMEQDLAALPSTDFENRASLFYALGKAYDDAGDTETAFARYAEGARLSRSGRAYDPSRFEAYVDMIIRTFDATFLARQPMSRETSARPIFVMGLPRSGSTLVEQILASHSQVVGGGELPIMRVATYPLKNLAPLDLDRYVLQGGSDPWGGLAKTYLSRLNERFGTEGRVIDKTLLNTLFLGVIRLMSPQAPVIWMRRDPADMAWSCFRTRFTQGHDWSWSLDHIGRYFRAMDRLHAHWAALFGDAVLTVDYEALTRDPDTWIPRILAHCGLADEAATRSFHETKRAVPTASVAQVRRPISTGSVGGWRRYQDQMQPFFDAYGAGAT